MAFGEAMAQLSDLSQGDGAILCETRARTETPVQASGVWEAEGEEVFRAHAGTAPVLMWMSDLNGACVHVNSAWLQYTGRTVQQELGDGWTQGVHPEDAERRRTVSAAAFDARAGFSMEYRLRRADGRYGWVLDTAVPRYAKGGEYAGYIGSCIDITNRKESEALHATLETAMSQGMEGLALLDEEGAFVYMNQTHAAMYGFTVSELEGKTWRALYDPDQIALLEREALAGLSSHGRWRGEVVGRKKDGRHFYVELSWQQLTNVACPRVRVACACRDITERKWAEAALRESEERYALAIQGSEERFRLVVESAPCGMVMVNQEGRIVLINSQIETLFRYRRDELVGYPVERLIPERYRHGHPLHPSLLFSAPNARPLGAGHDLYGIRKDATEFPIEIGLTPIRTQEGLMALGSIVDMTERTRAQETIQRAHDELEARVLTRTAELTAVNAALSQEMRERQRAEAALLKSHALFRTLAAVSPVGIYRADRAGQCIYANERWSEITGLTPEESQGEGWAQTVHPDDRDQVFVQWHRAVHGGPPFRAEFRFQRADGALTWVLGQAAAELDDTGQINGFVGTITDISSRKRVETIRARENKILESIATGGPLTTILNDLITTIEEQLPGMLGSILTVDGSGTCLQHMAGPHLPETYKQALDGLQIGPSAGSCGAAVHFREQIMVEDIEASPLWASLSTLALPHGLRACWSRPILSRTGCVVGAFAAYFRVKRKPTGADDELLDVAVHLASIAIDHAQAEHALRQLNETLEERAKAVMDVNRELEAFSYSVSHDLAAPLRHLDGFAELLLKHAGPALDDRGRRYVAAMSAASTRMGALIDDLLAFSRVGRAEFMTRTVSLRALIQDVLHDLQADIEGRQINWMVHDLPDVVGDGPMLRLVFSNLIGNALKYTRHRNQAIIEIGHVSGGEDDVVVFVRDNGAGFDPRYADRLFGVFQRLHTAEEFEGNGIGLANVRRIVHRHGGRTWAEGKVDAGATFWLSLPSRRAEL